jgi:hypothetical protein
MNIYRISRTSSWGEKPCEEAFEGMRPCWDYRTFKTPEEHDRKLVGFGFNKTKPWLEEGVEHGTWEGGIKRRLDDVKVWLIEAESIDELFDRYGTLVVQSSWSAGETNELEVEIYDDYRE